MIWLAKRILEFSKKIKILNSTGIISAIRIGNNVISTYADSLKTFKIKA